MEKFDLVVIGAGPSGYAAAMRAIDFKKKVLLVEKDQVGGAGVTNGALSSKTWWELSRETASFRKNLRRFNLKEPSINYKEIQNEVKNAVAERMGMLEDHLNKMLEFYSPDGFAYRVGVARLVSQNEAEISNADGKTERFYGEHIILA